MAKPVEALVFKAEETIDLCKVSIKCHRVRLVSISDAFAGDIFREFTPEITKYMIPSPAQDISETLEFISRSIEGMQRKQELVLAITGFDNEFLGCVGLHGRGAYRTPELGIWLKKGAHRNKYGQEAVKHLFVWACEHLEFDYAIYPVDRSNIASRKIAEALGGTIYKEVVITAGGRTLDEIVYKILV